MSHTARTARSIALVPVWEQPSERQALLCAAFYKQVYRDCFPKPNEVEQPETWLPLMGENAPPAKPRVFIQLACAGGEESTEPVVLGGVVFEWYRQSGDWLMTYLAVRQDRRGAGLARRLFNAATRTIRAHATNTEWQLYAEAENPLHFAGADRAAAYARLPVLAALGLRRLSFAYIQPALDPTKHQLDNLMFLYWVRADAPAPTPARLTAFLREFYAALDQADSAALKATEAALAGTTAMFPRALPRTPARYDTTLGHAKAITLRMTFLAPYIKEDAAGNADAADSDIPLDDVRPAAQDKAGAQCWSLLSSEFQSFHADIVIPYASASSLPIILQCQPFRQDLSEESGTCVPPSVRLVFPRNLRTSWEGTLLTIPVSAWGEAEWVVRALLVDSVAFFESGYVAYSCAFVLCADRGEDPVINVTALLALMAIAQTAGRVIGEPVRIALDSEAPQSVHEFLRARLRRLAALAEQGECTAFSALARASNADTGATLRRCLLGMTFRDTANPARSVNTKVSVSLEMIGAERHAHIIKTAQEAAKRRASANAFTKRLAGLTQNVLDFERQDESEIHDSLAGGFRLGQDLSFAHRDQAIRFSRDSRAYEGAWAVVGGEPYWLLVDFVVSHNAKLLLDLNEEIRKDQGATGLTGLMRNMVTRGVSLSTPDGIDTARERLRRTQGRRIRLAHYIPNLFRYPTERALFEQFSDARGLTVQREYFLGIDDTMEKSVREIALLEAGIAEAAERTAEQARRADEQARQIDDGRRNNLLVAIGVVQATGVFAAFAAVFATFGTVPDIDLSSFGREVSKELGLGVVGEGIDALTKHVGVSDHQWSKMVSNMGAGDSWPLVAALALVAASFSFVGAVGLVFVVRQVTRRMTLGTSVGLAITLPTALVFILWILSRISGMPILSVLLVSCLVAGLAPGALYLLWQSRR